MMMKTAPRNTLGLGPPPVLGPQHSSSSGQLLQENVQAAAAVKDGDGDAQSTGPLDEVLQVLVGGLGDVVLLGNWTLVNLSARQCRSSMF